MLVVMGDISEVDYWNVIIAVAQQLASLLKRVHSRATATRRQLVAPFTNALKTSVQ